MKSSTDGCGCFPTGRHYAGIAHLLRTESFGVADELAAEGMWIDTPIAFLDTETTGRDGTVDRIVEVGIIIGQSGVIQKRYNWLLNPGIPIPEGAARIHGITDDQVKDCPSFADVAPQIIEVLRGSIPAAYNAGFDRSFLVNEMIRAGFTDEDNAPPALRKGVEWLDPLVWARHIQRQEKSKTLGDVTARLGIKLENAHRASDDAEAALLVMYAFGKDERVPRNYGALMKEQRRLWKIQEQEFQRWRNRT
jgi:DNA polymerase-3 subunit epsilon